MEICHIFFVQDTGYHDFQILHQLEVVVANKLLSSSSCKAHSPRFEISSGQDYRCKWNKKATITSRKSGRRRFPRLRPYHLTHPVKPGEIHKDVFRLGYIIPDSLLSGILPTRPALLHLSSSIRDDKLFVVGRWLGYYYRDVVPWNCLG